MVSGIEPGISAAVVGRHVDQGYWFQSNLGGIRGRTTAVGGQLGAAAGVELGAMIGIESNGDLVSIAAQIPAVEVESATGLGPDRIAGGIDTAARMDAGNRQDAISRMDAANTWSGTMPRPLSLGSGGRPVEGVRPGPARRASRANHSRSDASAGRVGLGSA